MTGVQTCALPIWDYPRECFQISEFVVDRDTAWTEGFSVPSYHVNPLPESVAWPD